ncbi:hypothetical protein VTK73DRAFT_5322 [Phialemonium thermophilum]|uniref:Ubiquitin-like domain-containing protein n=1 Tax=Phialemonium thermophilum TaxID=223376 RepID=A0ABR3Y8B9_9PEZI
MAGSASAEVSPAPSQDGPPLAVNLVVVSPSVGVNGPLNFPGISVSTTVRELKEKIRSAVPTKPSDEQQRLIHRGRLLARDGDTLHDILGVDAVRSGEQQVLHLVLRDISDPRLTSTPASVRQESPAAGGPPARHPDTPQHPPPQQSANPSPHLGRGTSAHGFTHVHGVNHPVPAFVAPIIASQVQAIQQQHQSMVQWMNQLQREGGHRQRPATLYGIQNDAAQGVGAADNGSGRSSPAIGPHVTREVTGPDGQYWRLTVGDGTAGGRAVSPQPTFRPVGRVPLSSADIQNIMRGADATQATQEMTNAMQRSASGASLVNTASINTSARPILPGVTTPIFSNSSTHESRAATPDNSSGPAANSSHPTVAAARSRSQSPQVSTQPEVYILSSPAGPRALLINGASETYLSPAIRQPLMYAVPYMAGFRPPVQPHAPWAPHLPIHLSGLHAPQGQQVETQARQAEHELARDQGPAGRQRQRGAHLPIPVPIPHHHRNLGAGAFAAAAWPHIWLIVRLIAFVWWFTSSDMSWSRWFAFVFGAIVVFIFNTGLFNGVANQIWDPFRRHLEGLMPLGGAGQGVANADNNTHGAASANLGAPRESGYQPGGGEELDPAATAARLVAERRNANANWLMDQVRRLERAGLLFLASIAPGVAERHIALIEAEERRRREAEQAAREEAVRQEAAAREEAAREAGVAAQGQSGVSEGMEAGERSDSGPASQPANQEQQVHTGG